MSWVAKIKEREIKNREELLHLLKVKESQMSSLFFEVAYEYLENVFGTDAYGVEHIPQTAEFWTWWKMEWAKIDSIFLHAISHDDDEAYEGALCILRDRDNVNIKVVIRNIHQLRNAYRIYHEATMQNRYINSGVVQAGMHKMMNSVINRDRNPVNHG